MFYTRKVRNAQAIFLFLLLVHIFTHVPVLSAQTSFFGDATSDGKVNGQDYVIWLDNYDKTRNSPSMGNFNTDTIVNVYDYHIWFAHYGKSIGNPTSLSEYGNLKNLYMGAAMRWDIIESGERQYFYTFLREYNHVVPENEFKPKAISKIQGAFDFSTTDKFVQWAQQNNLNIGAHTLVWHNSVPSWLESGNFSNAYIETWLENYIKTVVSRYKGRIQNWDVVNEPVYFSPSTQEVRSRTDSFWYRKLGPSYIEKAFRWAHEADPNARLFLNEYSTEWNNPKTSYLFTLVQELKNKGVPIHGVGFQMHETDTVAPSYDQIYTSMKRFADIGMEIIISELDVAVGSPITTRKLDTQAQIYSSVVRACTALMQCKGITTWGFTDKYSWMNSSTRGSALPFDEQYNKKPAYTSITEALR